MTACVNTSYGTEPVPMKADQVELFSKLYRVYPDPEFGQPMPLVRGKDLFETRIWSINTAEECSLENFDSACKGQMLYITVSDGEIGGKSYGISFGKAFGLDVLELDNLQDKRCVRIKLAERVIEKRNRKMAWGKKIHTICVSPEGLVR